MISIAFNGTAEEVTKEMRVFLAGFGALPSVPSTPAKESKPEKMAPKEESKPEKMAPKEESKPETMAPKGKEVDIEDVHKDDVRPSSMPDLLTEIKAIIPKLVKKLGRPAVVELLAEFGATSGGEIKEADRMTFLTKAKSLLDV